MMSSLYVAMPSTRDIPLRFIGRRRELEKDIKKSTDKLMVYPIIVLHNHQFNVPGLNQLVSSWFQMKLERLSKNGYNNENIQEVVIVTIDALITYISKHRGDINTFKGDLTNYIKYSNERDNCDYQYNCL